MIDYEAELPTRMRHLPRDVAGRPVPKFVEMGENGEWDFRLMSRRFFVSAARHRLCWICGDPLGARGVFAAGPMCLVNLNSAEPPSHYECARYSARHCPFLINPDKQRRESNLPAARHVSGVSIPRNPGVVALIVTRTWRARRDFTDGVLFTIGPPERVEWLCRGEPATRAEVDASIAGGQPVLEQACGGDPEQLAWLGVAVAEAQRFLP